MLAIDEKMKKLNRLLNIIMGCAVVVLIGYSLFKYIDYTNHPGLYATYSAPWYTSILLCGAVTLFIVVISLIAKNVIRRKLKRRQSPACRTGEL